MSAGEVVAVIERDRPYYETSAGGVTLSGGEPLFQYRFAADILARCRARGLHTAIETAGWSSARALAQVLRYTDLVFFDLKTMDPGKHERVIGKPLARVIANARLVAASGVPLVVRVPVVPGFNDDEASMRAIMDFAGEVTSHMALLAYHQLARAKYDRLGREYSMGATPATQEDTLTRLAALGLAKGLEVTCE